MVHGWAMTMHATVAAPLVTRILHLPITSDAEAFVTAARASERALVHLGSPTLEHRGKLERFVVEGIEAELGRLGAAPPGWRYDEGIEAIASDQLYRARLLGHSGLALRFETLGALADAEGQLGAEDSRTLRRLVALAEREPLQLYLSRRCAELQIIGDPEPLGAWLPPSIEPGRVAAIEYDPGSSAGEREALGAEHGDAALVPPRIEAFVGIDETPIPPSVGSEELERSALDPDRETLPPPPVAALALHTPESVRGGGGSFMDASELGAPASSSPGASPAPPSATCREPLTPQPARAAEPERIEPERIQRCIAWANQLHAMSGPKVHGSIEKAFITTYLPLCREISAGVAPAEAAASARKWAEGFAQGYASAFRQLNARPRRPLMVKDVVDVGVRWLGQHYARQCQLLLVNALRFDIGQRLNEEIEHRLGQGAVCADQCVLWSALPSNADAQQLAEPGVIRRSRSEAKPESPPVIEPLRVGTRSLFKLDHVPGDLTRSGEPEGARLERLARELADVIVPWMRQQPPETLMVVFGDHGFHWQAHPAGTSAAQCGGALPEQVLVPASAWLLREPRQRARVAPGIH
jgi:hypothetical protein